MNHIFKESGAIILIFAFGVVMIMSGIFNWDFFVSNPRTEWFIMKFGRGFVQMTNILFGSFLILVSIYLGKRRMR